jgi:hypothetical protein
MEDHPAAPCISECEQSPPCSLIGPKTTPFTRQADPWPLDNVCSKRIHEKSELCRLLSNAREPHFSYFFGIVKQCHVGIVAHS